MGCRWPISASARARCRNRRPGQAWRLLCANWRVFRGTPVRYWFDSELGDIFGVTQRPSADNADALYDQISAKLAEDVVPAPRAAQPLRHRR